VWGSAPWLPFEALVGAVVLAGLLGLPTFTVLRLSLSILVPEGQRRTAAKDAGIASMAYRLLTINCCGAGARLCTSGGPKPASSSMRRSSAIV